MELIQCTGMHFCVHHLLKTYLKPLFFPNFCCWTCDKSINILVAAMETLESRVESH